MVDQKAGSWVYMKAAPWADWMAALMVELSAHHWVVHWERQMVERLECLMVVHSVGSSDWLRAGTRVHYSAELKENRSAVQ